MGWNYEDCLQRLTERPFYVVSTLSGFTILKSFVVTEFLEAYVVG